MKIIIIYIMLTSFVFVSIIGCATHSSQVTQTRSLQVDHNIITNILRSILSEDEMSLVSERNLESINNFFVRVSSSGEIETNDELSEFYENIRFKVNSALINLREELNGKLNRIELDRFVSNIPNIVFPPPAGAQETRQTYEVRVEGSTRCEHFNSRIARIAVLGLEPEEMQKRVNELLLTPCPDCN